MDANAIRKMVQEAVRESQIAEEKAGNPNEARFKKIEEAITAANKAGYQPGDRLGRTVRALAAGDFDPAVAIKVIHDDYKDAATAAELERTLEAGTPDAGGFLVPDQWAEEIIPFLRPMSLITRLSVRQLPNPTGTLHIRRQSSASTAYWKPPEGGKIKASQPGYGRMTLRDKALTCLVPMANKLLRVASVEADRFVLLDMLASVAQALDEAAFLGTGDEWQPKGLFNFIDNGVNNVTVGARVTADTPVDFIVKHLDAKGTLVSPHWVMSPKIYGDFMKAKSTTGEYLMRPEMATGTILGIPYHYSQILPYQAGSYAKSYLGLVDAFEFILAITRNLEVARSEEAAYYDAAGNIVASFGMDETVVRTIWHGDMGPRQLASFTLSNDVWTADS